MHTTQKLVVDTKTGVTQLSDKKIVELWIVKKAVNRYSRINFNYRYGWRNNRWNLIQASMLLYFRRSNAR